MFSIIFRIQWKLFRILMKFPLWGCQNWNIRVQSNNLRKKFCFLKKMHLLSISDFERKTFAPFSSFFSTQLSKLLSNCLKEHLKGLDFFPEKFVFFYHFGRLKQTFQPFVETFTAGLSNLRFACPSKQFEGKKFLRKLCFVDLQAWAKSFRHSL